MDNQKELNYYRVAKAIEYIQTNFKLQPTLNQIAEHVNLSEFHFQKLFSEWAGVSPKKFLQYISTQYAKEQLNDYQSTLFDTTEALGLSSTGRLHDLFVKIEGMTPGEFKNKGQNLNINYCYSQTHFGTVLTASTHKGICYMGFSDNNEVAFLELKNRFINARFNEKLDEFQSAALEIYNKDWKDLKNIKLHLKGTEFQIKVWEALLKIPEGQLSTYGKLAKQVSKPNASRAVGTAIGKNPVALLIPCHRVIQSMGGFGGYMWGESRKAAIIGYEASKTRI